MIAHCRPDAPRIEYPCRWTYRIIGTGETAIRALVRELLGDSDHEIALSRASRTGKYISLKLTLVVRSEMHRLMLYRRLGREAAIRYVL